ncbi:MAG: hypothetical protein ACFE0O_15145 [Opitutales bacterium]
MGLVGFRWPLVASLFLLGTLAAQSPVAPEELFLRDILLGRDLASAPPGIYRWERAPTIAIVGGNPRHREAVEAAINDLQRALKPVGFNPTLLEEPDESADIVLYYVRFYEVGGVVERLGLPARARKIDEAHPIFGETGTLRKAVVFIDERWAAPPPELKLKAMKLILAAMGMPGQSRLAPKSVFYEVPTTGLSSELVTDLSRLDVKAIRLLYVYLKPGESLDALARSYDRHWSRLR